MTQVLTQHGINSLSRGGGGGGDGVVIGGKLYSTVTIAGKEWLAENLDLKLPGQYIQKLSGTTNNFSYNTQISNLYYDRMNLLYNWYAVKYINDNRASLCPGWKVPTRADMIELFTRVSGYTLAGTKTIKSTTGWSTGLEGDNSTGFDLKGGGLATNSFSNLLSYAYLWVIDEVDVNNAYMARVDYTCSDPYSALKYYSASLRLIKE